MLDVLNRQLAEHGLEYGPEPATHYNCTLGGMIGNNSCGATAQRTGKVVDNIARLEVLLLRRHPVLVSARPSDEEYAEIVAAGGRRAEVYRQLRGSPRRLRWRRSAPATPTIPRRVSGYNLDSLLPENGLRRRPRAGRLASRRCVTVLRAELKLVPGRAAPDAGRARLPRHRRRRRRRARGRHGTARSRWRASTTG